MEEDNNQELLCTELEGRLEEEDPCISYVSMDEETGMECDEGLFAGGGW